MDADLQYRTHTLKGSPHDYRTKVAATYSGTSQAYPSPHPTFRFQFPQRYSTRYHNDAATPNPVHQKDLSDTWRRERGADGYNPHKHTTEEWVDEQIHFTHRLNDQQANQPLDREQLRRRMWDELLYEYETEAQKWMKHESEIRQRDRERELEDRKRAVQEDISRIEARVRQRRDSERQAIAEERRRSVEKAMEMQRKEQDRLKRAALEAWNGYESRWAAIASGCEALGFEEIPWPVLVPPREAADITADKITTFILHPAHSLRQSRKERIRSALLRWHPDRFRRLLQRIPESERKVVEEGICEVTKCLNHLLVVKEDKSNVQVSFSLSRRTVQEL